MRSIDPTIAATMPNLKGHGTLADLQVALTQNPAGALASAIAATLPTLDTLDITELRDRALPILAAWAQAPLDGVPALPGGANPDVAILVDRSEVRTQVLNFAMRVTETVDIEGTPTEVTYWKLASGQAHDSQGAIIPYPTLAEVLAQDPSDPDQEWDVMAGSTIDFLERYFGGNVPRNRNMSSTPAQPRRLRRRTSSIARQSGIRLAARMPHNPRVTNSHAFASHSS